MDNFDLRNFLAEGKLYEANSPELDKAKEDYMAGKISLADYQAIVKKLDFKGVKDAEAKAQAKADALAAEKKELEDKKAAVKQAEKDRKAGKISSEEFAKIVQNNQYINKESLSEETEALSREEVVDMAQKIADEFSYEDAQEGGSSMVYMVGDVDGMRFELDTKATNRTPADDAKYGTGEGMGGNFRIDVKPNGYEIRNSEKGGLVATMDMEDGFRMLSADESRAELEGEPDVDWKNDELDMKRMEEGVMDKIEDFLSTAGEGADNPTRPSLGEETKSNKMKKSELKEMIRQAMLAETQVEETLVDADQDMAEAILNALGGEAAFEAVVRAMSTDDAQTYLGAIMRDHDIEMGPVGDIPGFEGTMDALDSLSLREEEEDEEVELEADVEDTEVEDAGEIDVEANAEVGITGDKKEIQDNLEAALEAAKALGDQKLADQIGNSITFFTRTHVVGKDQVAEDLSMVRMLKNAGVKK